MSTTIEKTTTSSPSTLCSYVCLHDATSGQIEKSKKQLRLLLKEHHLLRQLKDFDILLVKDEIDAERKLLNTSLLSTNVSGDESGSRKVAGSAEGGPFHNFPLLYIRLVPMPGNLSIGNDLHRRLLDMGCIPAHTETGSVGSGPLDVDNDPSLGSISKTKLQFVYDLETSDPGDVFALLFLLSAPAVLLKLVTINPGTRDQVGLVYSILQAFRREDEILIGSGVFPHKPRKEKNVVDVWYKRHFHQWDPRDADGSAADLLRKFCNGETTMVTGGAWTNIARAIGDQRSSFELGTLVAQGGFASRAVCNDIPQLEKFQDQEYMSSYNMNANPMAVQKVASYQGISCIKLVSKNICHREVFDRRTLAKFPPNIESLSQGLAEIKRIMSESYFDSDSPDTGEERGKKIHDIVAAACAIVPEIATWRQVEIIGKSGAWGTKLSSDSRIFITVDYDSDKFQSIFFQSPEGIDFNQPGITTPPQN